jgi:hypothetical protein
VCSGLNAVWKERERRGDRKRVIKRGRGEEKIGRDVLHPRTHSDHRLWNYRALNIHCYVPQREREREKKGRRGEKAH